MYDRPTLVSCLYEPRRLLSMLASVLFLCCMASCGGGGGSEGSDVCSCTPAAPASQDFRHAEKHVPLPSSTPVQTTVAQILGWAFGPDPVDSTLRTGRELTLYQVTTAYLQNARLINFDCDVHFEISDVPDKNAPRVIVETPIDSEYCPSRKAIADGLAQHHFQLQYIFSCNTSLTPMLVRLSYRRPFGYRSWGSRSGTLSITAGRLR